MDQIRPWLYIGNLEDSKNHSYLQYKSINAILQFEELVEHEGIATLYIPVQDGLPIGYNNFQKGLDFIKEQKSLNKKILVACAAGISRSSTFCTAALKMDEGLTLLEAFKEVVKSHSDAMPNEAVWISLCNFYEERASYLEVMRLSFSAK